MNDQLPDIVYDHRIAFGVPGPFKAALVRAAEVHRVTIADFCREALNVALSNEPTAGNDGNFALLRTEMRRSANTKEQPR
jgi:hypothetical protein